jgi:hypothetical protein
LGTDRLGTRGPSGRLIIAAAAPAAPTAFALGTFATFAALAAFAPLALTTVALALTTAALAISALAISTAQLRLCRPKPAALCALLFLGLLAQHVRRAWPILTPGFEIRFELFVAHRGALLDNAQPTRESRLLVIAVAIAVVTIIVCIRAAVAAAVAP